jgi:hypothetical protein
MTKNRVTFAQGIKYVLGFLLIALFLGGQFLQWNTGWADNGDFRRSNQLFTDKPVGFETNTPAPDSPEFQSRYANYWLPVWNFKWGVPSINSAFSSTILLWMPGAVINAAFVSTGSLYSTVLSILPRLLVGFCLVLLMRYAWNDLRQFLIWGFGFILPLILMAGTSHYAAYFNAFYQELGSLVYLIMLVIWLIIGLRDKPKRFRVVGLILLVLLTTTKSSNFFFPFLFLPLIFNIRDILKKPVLLFSVVAVCVLAIAFSILFVGDRSTANRYHSIFMGVLVASENPAQRLQEIGITDPSAVIDCKASIYTTAGQACAQKFTAFLSYRTTAGIIFHEPKILYYQAERLSQFMQRTDIGLGQFAMGYSNPYSPALLNAWANLKEQYFPRGWWLYGFLLLELTLAVIVRFKYKRWAQLANLALVLTLSCFLAMELAILGDGIVDLVKHLFLANILFDLSATLSITVGLLALFTSSQRSQIKINTEKRKS